MLPAHLQTNTAADLKALSAALKEQLATHPVHKAILDGAADEAVLTLLARDHGTTALERVDGRTAFDFAVRRDDACESAAAAAAAGSGDVAPRPVGAAVVTALLAAALPVDASTKLPRPPHEHGCCWVTAVQYDRYAPSVGEILAQHALLAAELAGALDAEGRRAVDIASPTCKRLLLQCLHFFKRYEVQSLSRAHHSSATCQLHLATDHGDGMRPVALKFMRHRDQFTREVEVRTKGQLDGTYVVSVLRCHDPDTDVDYAGEVQRKGLSKYPYLVVMDAGERNLADVLNKVHTRDLLPTVCLPHARALLTLPPFTHGYQSPSFLSLSRC